MRYLQTLYRANIVVVITALAFAGFHGSAVAGVNDETVAIVNGDEIKGVEVRESLGLWGGTISASGIPAEKKKEALDRLIDGRLLEQAARAGKWDTREEFLKRVKDREEGLLVPVLFRSEFASRVKIDQGEIRAESARLRKKDKNLSKEAAWAMAKRTVWQSETRKLEQELIAAALEEASAKVEEEAIERIGKGGQVEDNTVLGTAGSARVSFGDIRNLLGKMRDGGRGGQDPGANPKAVRSLVARELTGISLVAYARKRNVEDTDWMRMAHRDLERMILIDLFTENEILQGVGVSEKEIGDAYAKHAQMLLRDGKRIPLSEVKEDIRRIVQSEKRRKAMNVFKTKLKKKAKIRINDKLLQKV